MMLSGNSLEPWSLQRDPQGWARMLKKTGDWTISSQASHWDEGSTTIPEGSRGKRLEAPDPQNWGEEIVSSASKDAAARKRAVQGVATLREDTDFLGGYGLFHTDASQSRIVKWDSAS